MIGSGNVWIHEKYAKHIRMSDIMAASSCIPGAMEPIMFPQDFHWPGDPEGKQRRKEGGDRPTCKEVEEYVQAKCETKSVPLMDGGIYDNQGTTSIILSAARNYGGSNSDEDDDQYDEQLGLEPLRPRDAEQLRSEPLRPHAWAKWAQRRAEKGSGDQNQRDIGDVDLSASRGRVTPLR